MTSREAIKDAHQRGLAAREKYASITDAIYGGECSLADTAAETIAWEMGFAGKSLELVQGWRYGKPVRDISYNYRDQQPERGISLMALVGEKPSPAAKLYEVFNRAGRRRVYVEGYYSGTGADGEPLMIGVRVIRKPK